jgi:hypothetical protein
MKATRGSYAFSLLLLVLSTVESAVPFDVLPSAEAEWEPEAVETGLPLDNLRVLNSSEIYDLAGEEESLEVKETGRAIDNFRDNFLQDPFLEKEARQGN